MENKLQFIDNSRVFINPAVGCSSECAFCYIESLGFTHLEPSQIKGADIKKSLLDNPQFIPGLNGTIISLSPDTEPFDKRVTPITLDYISSLSELGNPMQIATRRSLDKTLIRRLVNSLAYPNQLTIFVSSCSIKYHDVFERNTTVPSKRFETLGICQSEGLSVCLYIKPVIPNITILDAEEYARVINNYSVSYCCIGEFYIDASIRLQINQVLKNLGFPEIEEGAGKYTSPFSSTLHQISNFGNKKNLSNGILLLEEYIQKNTTAAVHRTSTCIVSNILHIPSAEKKWITYPHLCVQCQDCDGMARKASSPIF